MKEITSKKAYIYLVIIIFSQLGLLMYYMNQKAGFHIDELWSYSFSNSISSYPIYSDEFGYNQDYLFSKWFSGKYYNDLLTVTDKEKFNYKKVKENTSLDLHPPFYYYLLHTICSFFPNSFSKWYGFIINILVFFVTQIILFLITKELFSDKIALLSVMFYGFTSSAINTFLNIRMYGLLTFFFLLVTYEYIKIFENRNYKIGFLVVLFTVFIGSYTHYHFILYVFYLTLVFDICCLLQKKYNIFLYISLAALLGILILWILYPVFIKHLFYSPRGCEAVSSLGLFNIIISPWQIKLFFHMLFCHLFGLDKGVSNYLAILFNSMFSTILIIIILSFALNNVFKLLSSSVYKYTNKISSYIVNSYNKNNRLYFVAIALYLFILTITPTINYKIMSIFSMRYFCPIYPFIAISIVFMVFNLLKLDFFNKYKNINLIVILFFFLFSMLGQFNNLVYLFPEIHDTLENTYRSRFNHIFKESNIVVLVSNVDKLHDLSVYLKDCNKCACYTKLNEVISLFYSLDFSEKQYLVVSYTKSNYFFYNSKKSDFNYKFIGRITNLYTYDLFEIIKK